MKILHLDIETAPVLANVWGIWDQNVGLDMIERDWYILSLSANWDTEKEIIYYDQRHEADIENDKGMLIHLRALLDEADVVVAHNGKRFDIPKINARFLLNGIHPPSPYRVVDTLRIVKSNFAFTSNKLEFLSDKLLPKNKKKLKHKNFPGFMLWKECMAGNIKAWEEMEKYNRMDVVALKALYHVLLPWSKQKPNFAVIANSHKKLCPSCGSHKVQSRGVYHTNACTYQRYFCTDCNSWSRDKVIQNDKAVRKNMLVGVTY